MGKRATSVLVLSATIALIAIGCALSRPDGAVDADAGDPLSAAEPSSAADPSGPDDPSVPVPAHLRRVAVTFVFDDGTPFVGVETRGRIFEQLPVGDGRGAASTVGEEIDCGTTTASGRVSFLVPRAAEVLVFALSDGRYPPFQSDWLGPEVVDARVVIAAAPLRFAIVDEAGRPVPDLTFVATGSSSFGGGTATATTDAEGRAIFRGFAPAASLLVELGRFGAGISRDCDRFVVTAVLGGERSPPGSLEGFRAAPPADVKVTVRRLPTVDVRVVDPTGKPVAWAMVGVSCVFAGSAKLLEYAPDSTNRDGRFSRTLPLNGRDVGQDVVLVEVRCSVVTRDGSGPYVVVRPGPPSGEGLDAGDVVVPAERLLEFQVEDESGKPVDGATVMSVGPDGLPDFSRPDFWTDDDGRVIYPARAEDVRFFCGDEKLSDVFVDAPVLADAAADAAVRKIVLRRAASFLFEPGWTDEARRRDNVAVVSAPARKFSRLTTRSAPPDAPFPVSVDLRPATQRSLDGIEPGTAVTIEFRDWQGTYAADTAVAPAAGETRTIVAPPPPLDATLIAEVSDVNGLPMNVAEVLVRTIPTVGEPIVVARGRVVDGRCVVAWLRAGRVQVRVDSDPSTDVEVALTAPETKLVVRLPVQRVVVLALVGPDANEPPDDFSADAFANGRQLNALLDDVPEELPPPPDEKGRFVSTRAPADAPVEFRLRWGGTDYSVTAGPGVARVEWAPPAAGRLLVKQLRRVIAATFEVRMVRIGPSRDSDAVPPPSVRSQRFAPGEDAWVWEPIILMPGRYRIELYETAPNPGNPEEASAKLQTSSEVEIFAGRTTTLDFPR